ncbi:cell division protein SepF [Egibacter rhizosphaerae]|uniref:Cell division protein SepF n=1 Tax=Egibacter rhizosphaerae TaxID=1670831 RepID=A0A411YAC6_9ACTN|nr:cell division protein SepF [Egibacter rhizosphaerae]QBI18127.1 cell division protein SepF [Egibacter rhizosphaerae]
MSGMVKRTLAYLGLVEEYEDEYARDVYPDDRYASREPARAGAPRRDLAHTDRVDRFEDAGRGEGGDAANVRRLAPPPADRDARTAAPRGQHAADPDPELTAGQVHVTSPTTFNDVEEVGERFRNGIPVIMNLASASESVAKRMLDFASGLIFGLDGRIERVGDRVFLLTPSGLQVSSEERRRLGERGFFNQA